ncbi:MAG: 2-oxoacid:acceptor oxidoreductase subunit alpha [Bacillati bacterium ANGP1]|uniref:2-oxoacid:acceptor oxidoreductase subunit alpha n=1 Tax=Candidatus Segetimicrobium genomatis TaxID=2569760 RepID=A0A537LND2_9BACT|nr:MAG: 2-oxoacid:acceptor oxidoreductase subunit alpha [Terrabacteria group bacterium ANGP1]
MIVNRMKLLVGGVQLRDGVSTITDLLGRILTRAGLQVMGVERGFASTIYGAHQYDPLLITAEPAVSWGDESIDVLVGLEYDIDPDVPEQPNRDSVYRHARNLVEGGLLLYDSSSGSIPVEKLEARGVRVFPIPARQIAIRDLKKEVVKNVVMTGALFRLLEFDRDEAWLRRLLEERFGRKGPELVTLNLEAARRGRAAVEAILGERGWPNVGYRLEPRPNQAPAVYIAGNEALVIGAIEAGVRFYAGYPITPASSILEFMERHLPRYGGRALQGSNERESIRAALGASAAGAVSMIGTSGPGLSLKVEEFGVSGVTETPLVIVDAMRAGPSTGMPTKSEQGDLFLVTGGGHGEIPRIVLAPASIEECYTLIYDAVRLAETYQCPVFFMSDLNLGEGRMTLPQAVFRSGRKAVERRLATEEQVREIRYMRYRITDTGIPPRLVPGTRGGVSKMNSTEHDEFGLVTTDPPKRVAMMDKRMRKMTTYLHTDAKPPQVYGQPGKGPLLVGWGSTRAVLLDAQKRLQAQGLQVAVAHFTHLWPFPTHLAKPILEAGRPVIVCEHNYLGQLAELIQAHTLIPARRVLKYNGRPFYPSEVVRAVNEVAHNGAVAVRLGGKEPVMVEVSTDA